MPELQISTYVANALKTENIDFKGIRERLENPKARTLLLCLMRAQVQVGMLTEIVKKHIFYGKPLPDTMGPHQWPLQQADAAMREDHGGLPVTKLANLSDASLLRLLHAWAGITSEAGEITEPIYKHLVGGKAIDWSNLEEEVGDNQWYIAVLSDVIALQTGHGLVEILAGNNAKLEARYKGGSFDTTHAMERDKAAEDKARAEAQDA